MTENPSKIQVQKDINQALMKSLALKILTLCVYNIKDDVIIKSFLDIALKDETAAFTGYGNICRTLIQKKQKLSDYLRNILLNTDIRGVSSEYLEYDLFVIRELCEFKSEKIKAFLIENFNKDAALSLPSFENGNFDYKAEYFLEKARRENNGIFSKHKAFTVVNGEILPVLHPDKVMLSDLKEYKAQKEQIIKNTECFINGKKAQNVLLYGDRGTGKSSTVKALVNRYENLRIIETDKNNISFFPVLFDGLRSEPFKFILFLDDLVFEAGDNNFNLLKQTLEGSVVSKPDNVLIYATTNRRHIIKESAADRDHFHRGDALDDNVSLSDRFGLYITYSLPDKELYLKIVKELAADAGLTMNGDILEKRAESYALKRGGRSPRIASQFIVLISSEET